jgi:two-component system, cell cycle sensor histidine kinase and response regulator CckA
VTDAEGKMFQPTPRDLQGALDASERRAEGLQARLDGTQGILDAISEAIYIQDAEGRFLDVNEGAARMYGHPREFFLGKTPEILSAPGRNDLGMVVQALSKALRGEPQQFEYWGLKADGTVFPKDVHLYPGTYLGQKVVIAIAQDISKRKRAEQISHAAYRISEAALDAKDLPTLYRSVHAILRTLVPAENCYIALHDPSTDTLSWPYWVDQVDEVPASRPFGRGLTEYVIRTGQPQLIDEGRLTALAEAGEAKFMGAESMAWMGVPLRNDRCVYGALVIQSYEGGYRYLPEDLEILSFVSAQIAMAIDRKTSEEQLRFVSAAVDVARDSLFWVTEDGNIEFVNDAACQRLGYTRQEFLSLTIQDIDPSVTLDVWKASLADVRKDRAVLRETTQRRKDGTYQQVEVARNFVRFGGRELLFSAARDIEERKKVEAALQASEEKFSRAFHASPDAININRLDGTYVDINPAFTRMSGWSREETLGRSTLELGMWVDLTDRARMQKMLQADGQFTGLEAPFRMKDGSIRTGLVSGTLIQVNGENCLLTVTRDITDRKAAEAAIRYSEDKFSRAFHASPDAINITRLDDGTYLDVSEGFEKITGWTRAEAVGRTALDMNIWVNPEDRQQAVKLIREQGEYTGLEIQFRRKDGSVLTGLMSGKAMEVDGVPCLLSITRDITERQQTEEALRQSQKLESLGILAGGIAHDFNNLLTVVLGNLNLAQMHLPENAQAQPYLAKMETTVLRATELTKQMLAYSGRGHFLVKPQDLNEAVQDVTRLLEVSISKNVHLRFDLEPGLPAILADAAQIQQVVMNLVTNASDAIGDREGIIHLSTATAFLDERELRATYRGESLEPGSYVILEVTDTGLGMTPDVMARIFDPFFTTKASGRGLGLSAMLGILRGHKAGLRIRSEVDRGSTFRLCFPASPERPATSAPAIEEVASHPLRGRVLLVDDEEPILQTIGSALRALGLEVITARDGLEALEQFKVAMPQPDLVLMDLSMPRMDGRDAFRAMHQLNPAVPIILSSGFNEQDSIQTLSGQNPAGFMQKPYQIKELRQLLQRVLGR